MKKIQAAITLLIFIYLSNITPAQYPENRAPNNPPPDYVYRNEQKQREMDAINGKDEKGMIKQPQNGASFPNSKVLKQAKENQAEKVKVLAEINAKYYVYKSYRNKYAEFLKGKNTGIARMFPDINCDKGLTVTVQDLERCANNPQVKGSGSRYSIRFREIPANYSLDIILGLFEYAADMYYTDEKMMVGNRLTQSIISDAGNLDIETLDLKSEAFSFIKSFKPSKNIKDVEIKNKILENGIKSNGYTYSNTVPIKLNSTYVLRSIAFSNMTTPAFWNTDIYVAFKVVGKEDDGSIIFIWKKLKQKKSPTLELK